MFDDDEHVCGHLNSRTSIIFYILNITKVNKYFIEILNSWIVLPTKKTKLKIQQIYPAFSWVRPLKPMFIYCLVMFSLS